MPVALIVENGSVVSGANTWVDLVYADTYFEFTGRKENWDLLSTVNEVVDDDVKASFIYRGALWIRDQYDGLWKGTQKALNQPLPWPRYGVYDNEGYVVDGASIPERLKEAQAEAAFLFANGIDMYPTVVNKGQLRRINVGDESIEQEFFKTDKNLDESRYLSVEKKIVPYLTNPPGSGFSHVRKIRG